MKRRKTRPVEVGPVTIGGGARVSIQSMTKTHTEDVDATVQQIEELAEIGCEIIRCAVPNRRAAAALEKVVKRSALPLIADIHFEPDLALRSIDAGADGIRINPGNMEDTAGLREVFRRAGEERIKVRVGVNSGSARPRDGLEVSETGEEMAELMVREALEGCQAAEAEGCESLVVSLKASDVVNTVKAYRLAADRCDYPFHVGVTAAGPQDISLVKSAMGIGALLLDGIGDTIRVSMTGPPHDEIRAGRKILEVAGLREPSGPEIVSCPTCGRCEIDLCELVEEVRERLKDCDRSLRVAVMGCVVNGPGEAAECDVGVAGGKDFGFIFRNGKKIDKRPSSELADALLEQIGKLE
ncbi:MAG: flavodoxin-dependent (E)-4-hydroxy-3-methylbut-2-enyl-diphosphate synthase [Planctomycetes bacterium]|nr:flavodoxin-dependent (E)-4-hydroxy-3-methylbut-2-enyl-diphosphate synthase [Planctomycetota bacterium]